MRRLISILLAFSLLSMPMSAFSQGEGNMEPTGAPPEQIDQPGQAGQPSQSQETTEAGQPAQNDQSGQTRTDDQSNQADQNGQSNGGGQGRRSGGGRNAQVRENGGLYSINFYKADAVSVVNIFSNLAKVPVVVDPDLKGNITINCGKKLSLQEVLDVVNAALRVRGYTMVGGLTSKVIRVVPLTKAITDATSVATGKDVSDKVGDDDLITQVVFLDVADADKVKDGLKSLVSSSQASMTSIASSNAVIITDSAANVRKIVGIIKELDKDSLGAVEIEVYQCKYASSDSLATTLKTLFASKSTTTSTTGNQRMMMPGPMGQAANANASSTSSTSVRQEVTIASDSRTNSVVVTGARARIDQVVTTAKQLDVDIDPEVKVKVFPLKYADASSVADQLTELFEQSSSSSSGGGFMARLFGNTESSSSSTYAGLKKNKIVADVRTNSVIVTATTQNMKAFESMVSDLDAPKVFSEITRIYQLRYAQADDLAVSLNRLFQGYVVTTSSTSSSGSSSRSGSVSGSIQNRNFGSSSSSSSSDSTPLEQLKNITVVAETKTNSLLVTGPPNTAALMDDLIEKLDRRTAQVFIEVAIVDVTLDNESKFGVEWQWQDAHTSASGKTTTHDLSTNYGLSDNATGFSYSLLSGNLSALLQMLKTRSDVKVLSTPTITTSDNVEASISIGKDVPYLSGETTTDDTTTKTVAFQNVAIALTVTPHVNDATNVVQLEVNQTINEILGYESSLNNAPIVANREADTTISVSDGQTIVIGGIMKENVTKDESGVPILSQIPIIGELFKSKTKTKEKSELMVFLTPHILKGDADISTVTSQINSKLMDHPQTQLITPGPLSPAQTSTATTGAEAKTGAQ